VNLKEELYFVTATRTGIPSLMFFLTANSLTMIFGYPSLMVVVDDILTTNGNCEKASTQISHIESNTGPAKSI